MTYLCEVASITKEPLEYSLMVQSHEAVVVSVSRYDLLNKFSVIGLHHIKSKMNTIEDWVQERATMLMVNEYQTYNED
jgi:hypothetical protein